MIEVIPDMPEGTLGFRSIGELTAEDYRDVLIPRLRWMSPGELRVFPTSELEDAKRWLGS